MTIQVLDLEGKVVDNIPCSYQTLNKRIEECKEKYPPGKFHANLIP